MLGRLISSALIALFFALVIGAVVTAVFPQSLTVLEPVFCKDWQTLEIRTYSTGEPGEFTIGAACTGDGDVLIGPELFVAMCGLYFLPIFTLIFMMSVIGGKGRRERRQMLLQQYQQTGQIDFNRTPGMQSFTVAVNNLDTDMIADTLTLVKEALSDGVITKEEFEQIQARVTHPAAGTRATGTLSERLHELQQAYSQGLITQAEYDDKRRQILDNT